MLELPPLITRHQNLQILQALTENDVLQKAYVFLLKDLKFIFLMSPNTVKMQCNKVLILNWLRNKGEVCVNVW